MKILLSKLATLVFVILGMALGLFCAFFFITYLLRCNHIHISLSRLKPTYSQEEDIILISKRPSSKQIFPKRHSRSSHGLMDIDSIDDVDELRRIAQKYIEEEEYYYAEVIFEKIKKVRPDYPDIYWYLGISQEGQEDIQDAAVSFNEYGKSANLDYQKLLHIADFFIRKKDYKKASMFIEESLKIKDTPEAHFLFAQTYYHTANYKKAIEELNAILETDRNYPDVLELLAECYIKTKKVKEAVDAYQQAYDVESRPYFLYKIALLKTETGNYREAKSFFNRYISVESDIEKVNQVKELLKTATLNAMKSIPPEVERQTDFIANVSLIGILKSEAGSMAFLTIEGVNQEIREGDTILNDYYVLSIRESHVILIHNEQYVVLRSL